MRTFEDYSQLIERTIELRTEIFYIVEAIDQEGQLPRWLVSERLCLLSLEHHHAITLLTESFLLSAAVCLQRVQFESVLRAIWIAFGAEDQDVDLMEAELSAANAAAAKDLPSVASMLKDLPGNAPDAAVEMLYAYKVENWSALNSFVHAGFHAYKRHKSGYPFQLCAQTLRNANGLATIAGMMLALLTGNIAAVDRMNQIQREFADCLPDLKAVATT